MDEIEIFHSGTVMVVIIIEGNAEHRKMAVQGWTSGPEAGQRQSVALDWQIFFRGAIFIELAVNVRQGTMDRRRRILEA